MLVMRRGPDIADVKAGLVARVHQLVRDLLPSGKEDRGEWCVGSVEGEPGQSLRVHVGKKCPGVWCDFSTGEVGDALDLVAACLFRGDKKRAYRWGVSWLGLDDADPWRLAERRKEIQAAQAKADRDADEREEKYRRAAQRIFFGAQPLPGTPAWRYLTETRGIAMASLGRLPRALGFAPELYHGKAQGRFCGLVAAITDRTGQFVAVHRHFLRVEPDGRVVKALPGRDAKMSLGRYRDHGGYIRVWRGASGKPWNTPVPGEWVMVTEGLEDALTMATAVPEMRVACAVAVGNLAGIRWPDGLGGIFIVKDNDGDNAKTDRAYEAAIRAYRAQGLGVRLVEPPREFKDVNDMLRGERRA